MALHELTWNVLHTSAWGFWKLCPLRYNQASLVKWVSVGLISPFGRYQFTKFSFSLPYASWSLWMTVVLCGWMCCIFVAFFWWSHWHSCLLCKLHQKFFWTYLQCGTSFLYFYLTSSVPFCMFCYYLNWNLFLKPFLCWELNSNPWMSLYLLSCHGCWRVNVRILRDILEGWLGWVVGSFKVLCEGE